MSAKNYNQGKLRPSLVVKDMPEAFIELVKIREAGMAKGYDRMNWAESIGTDDAPRFLDENLDSIFRHLISYMSGEKVDPESGCHHMASVMCRAAFAIEYDMAAPTIEPENQDPCHGTLRDNLLRGEEMPTWLIELITKNDDPEYEFYHENDTLSSGYFAWNETLEGQDFWTQVERWQGKRADSLPEEPKS